MSFINPLTTPGKPTPGAPNCCHYCRQLFKTAVYVFIAGTAIGCCSQACAERVRPPQGAARG